MDSAQKPAEHAGQQTLLPEQKPAKRRRATTPESRLVITVTPAEVSLTEYSPNSRRYASVKQPIPAALNAALDTVKRELSA